MVRQQQHHHMARAREAAQAGRDLIMQRTPKWTLKCQLHLRMATCLIHRRVVPWLPTVVMLRV